MNFLRRILDLLDLGIVRVSGHSMAPVLKDGDYGLYRRLSHKSVLTSGTVVLVDHPHLGLIVKVLGPEIADDAYALYGYSTLSSSIDSLGTVSRKSIHGQLFAKSTRNGLVRLRRTMHA